MVVEDGQLKRKVAEERFPLVDVHRATPAVSRGGRLDPEDAAVAARGGGEEVPRDERYGRQCGSGR